MVQFYFLSILINILAGLVLVYGLNLTKKDYGLSLSDEDSSLSEEPVFSDEDDDEDPFADKKSSKEVPVSKKNEKGGVVAVNNPAVRIILGVLAFFVGVMKILSVYSGDIPVVGDLLPAIAGLFGGTSLLIEYFIYSSSYEPNIPDGVQSVFIDSRKYIGVLCIVAGILHFIFPKVLLL